MDTLTPSSETATDFPGLLRYWRGRRGYSQLALSLAAGVSQRHISFLESGRARPSREMVLSLADRLGVPLRQRNRLLLAGGFAPAYSEHGLGAPALQMVQQAVALILSKQEPYPAVVLDRFWNLLDANRAYRDMLRVLLGGRAPSTLEPGDARVNLMLTVFDPRGCGRRSGTPARSAATCCAGSGRNCRRRRRTRPRARSSRASRPGTRTCSGRAACRWPTTRPPAARRRRCCRSRWRRAASAPRCSPR